MARGIRFCRTFLHVARVSHAIRNACDSRMTVCFLTRATFKKVLPKVPPKVNRGPAVIYRSRQAGIRLHRAVCRPFSSLHP